MRIGIGASYLLGLITMWLVWLMKETVVSIKKIRKTMMFECRRCGNCCIDVGRTFWKNGNFEGNLELRKWQKNGDHEDGGKQCEMLRFEDGKAVCGIERDYGVEYKPDVCREHMGDKRCGRN